MPYYTQKQMDRIYSALVKSQNNNTNLLTQQRKYPAPTPNNGTSPVDKVIVLDVDGGDKSSAQEEYCQIKKGKNCLDVPVPDLTASSKLRFDAIPENSVESQQISTVALEGMFLCRVQSLAFVDIQESFTPQPSDLAVSQFLRQFAMNYYISFKLNGEFVSGINDVPLSDIIQVPGCCDIDSGQCVNCEIPRNLKYIESTLESYNENNPIPTLPGWVDGVDIFTSYRVSGCPCDCEDKSSCSCGCN